MSDFHIHIPYNNTDKYLKFIREQKLNLEIYFSSKSLDSLAPGDMQALKAKLDYNPLLTIHAPFMDLSPAAIDSKVRAATIERFDHVLDIAEELKVRAIVFHSGYEKWKYSLNIDLWLEKSLKTWKPIAERAAASGIKVCIENIFEDEPSNLRLLAENMALENFGICFDTGHLNLFSKVSLEDWLKALKPYILELHLHDNDTTADQHLPIGDGTFNFDALFDALEDKDAIYTLEAHNAEDALKSIERFKKYVSL